MAALNRIWRDPSFRSAVVQLLSMSPDRLAILETLLAEGFDVQEEKLDQSDLNTEELSPALAVLRVLYDIAHHDGAGIESTLRELDLLIQSDPDAQQALGVSSSAALLGNLLVRRPEFEEREFKALVQHARTPYLEQAKFGLDLRLATTAEGRERIIPVAWLELIFDFPVGGSHVLSVDIPDDVLEQLGKSLDRLNLRRRDWSKRAAQFEREREQLEGGREP